MRPLGPRQDHGGQTRPLRLDEAERGRIGRDKTIEAEMGPKRSNEAVEAG